MEQNVNYSWIQVQANHSCQDHSTCVVSHFTLCQNLLPRHKEIHVGNGQFVSVLFIIPIIIDVHGHRLEIYTLVSEIHENVDLVLGIKNVFELEGVINSWDCCVKFLNRSLLIFPKGCFIKNQKNKN